MAVGDICNREVVIAGPGESALVAASLMRERHVGDVIVVEESSGTRRPLGILTDRDLVLEVLAAEVDPQDVTIGDLLTEELLTVTEDEELVDALKRMRAHGVRRAPVVDIDGILLGLLTLDDALDLVVEQLSDLVQLISREQQRERRTRP